MLLFFSIIYEFIFRSLTPRPEGLCFLPLFFVFFFLSSYVFLMINFVLQTSKIVLKEEKSIKEKWYQINKKQNIVNCKKKSGVIYFHLQQRMWFYFIHLVSFFISIYLCLSLFINRSHSQNILNTNTQNYTLIYFPKFWSKYLTVIMFDLQVPVEAWLSLQEMDTATWVQILDEANYIPHSTNTLGKGMNPIILPPAMGK